MFEMTLADGVCDENPHQAWYWDHSSMCLNWFLLLETFVFCSNFLYLSAGPQTPSEDENQGHGHMKYTPASATQDFQSSPDGIAFSKDALALPAAPKLNLWCSKKKWKGFVLLSFFFLLLFMLVMLIRGFFFFDFTDRSNTIKITNNWLYDVAPTDFWSLKKINKKKSIDREVFGCLHRAPSLHIMWTRLTKNKDIHWKVYSPVILWLLGSLWE